MLAAVDDLIGHGQVSDPTWAALAARLDEKQILDVIFTVGCYDTLAWMYDSLQLDLETDLPFGRTNS